MPKNGTFDFSDPDDFRDSLRESGIELLLTVCGNFNARLTLLQLRELRLLLGREERPRIAYVSLAPELVFVTFAAKAGRPLIWGGVELQTEEVVFHSQGEQLHQRTCGVRHWASISLTPEHLAACGRVLTGNDLVPPLVGQVLRPSGAALARLRQLHAGACRLAEKKPELLAHPEVVRALEHDLIHALVTCLVEGIHRQDAAPSRRRAGIMAQFETVLKAHSDQPLRLSELCRAIGAPERTLRLCCTEFLGMGPIRYSRLQRLGMVRSELRHASPSTTSVSAIAMRHGFRELGRFAVAYRALFDEPPSATLWRAPRTTQDANAQTQHRRSALGRG
jgi:AraC-like DNA-binding protein